MSVRDINKAAVIELRQKCPQLMDVFKAVDEFVDLLQQNSWAYKTLFALLDKICNRLQTGNEINVGRFAIAVGFVEKSVEFYRQIMREKGIGYVTEFIFPASYEICCLYKIQVIFQNIACFDKEFRLHLAHTGFLEDMLANLVHMKHLTSECLNNGYVFICSVGLILNCSKHEDVVPIVRGLGTVDHILSFVSKGDLRVKILALTTLSHIVGGAELDYIRMDDETINYFLDCGKWGQTDTSGCYLNFITEEIMFALSRFARNDFNKFLIVGNGGLQLMVPVLQDGTDLEKDSAMAAVLELAKLPDIVKRFTKERGLREVLTKLQTADNQTLRKGAAHLLLLIEQHGAIQNPFAEQLENRTNILKILGCSEVKFVLDQLEITMCAGRHDNTDVTRTQLLHVLTWLAKSGDNHKQEIISRGGLELVTKILLGKNEEEKAEATNVLLELSSNADHRLVIQAYPNLPRVLQELMHSDNNVLSHAARAVYQALY